MPPTYQRSAGFANHKMPQPYARRIGRPSRVGGMPSTPSSKNGRPKSAGDSLDLVALSSESLGPANARSGEHHPESQRHFARNAADRSASPTLRDRAAEEVGSPASPAPLRLQRSPEMRSARRSMPLNPAGFMSQPAGSSPLRIFGQPLQVSPPRSLRTTARGNGTPMIQLARPRPTVDAPVTSLPLRFDSPVSGGGSVAPGLSFDQPQSHRAQPLILDLGDENQANQSGPLDFQIARRPPGAVASWLRYGSPTAESEVPQRETSLIYSDDEYADRGAPQWATTQGLAGRYEERLYEEQQAPLDLYGRPGVIPPMPRLAPSISPQGRWQPAPPLLPVGTDSDPLATSPPDSPFLARNQCTRNSARPSAHDHAPYTRATDVMGLFHAGRAPGRASVPARLSHQEAEVPITLSDFANEAPAVTGEAWPPHDAIRPFGASRRTKGGARVVSPREEHPLVEPGADAMTSPGETGGAGPAPPVAAPARNPVRVDEYGMIGSQYGSFIRCSTSPAAVEPSRPSSPRPRASPREPLKTGKLPSAASNCTDSPLSPISAVRRAARHNNSANNPPPSRVPSLGPSAYLFRRFPSKHWRSSRPAAVQVASAARSAKLVRRPDWKRYAVLVRGLWLRANALPHNEQSSPTMGASPA
jgi:hypothetical protein